MKVAILHTGEQLHFPDETPDEVMDMTVKRHLGIPEGPSDTEQLLRGFLMAVDHYVSDQRATAQDMALHSRDMTGVALMQSARHHDDHMRAIQEIKGSLGDTADGLVGFLAPALEKLGSDMEHLPEIVKAVNNLSKTILEVGRAYLAVAGAPREIYNEDGKPKGVRVIGSAKKEHIA